MVAQQESYVAGQMENEEVVLKAYIVAVRKVAKQVERQDFGKVVLLGGIQAEYLVSILVELMVEQKDDHSDNVMEILEAGLMDDLWVGWMACIRQVGMKVVLTVEQLV